MTEQEMLNLQYKALEAEIGLKVVVDRPGAFKPLFYKVRKKFDLPLRLRTTRDPSVFNLVKR